MIFLFNVIKAIVDQVEYLYQWLVDVLIDELIHGERNHDQAIVIQAFLIFIVVAVFSFYMELFVELYALVGVISLVFCQFTGDKKYSQNRQSKELLSDCFHESCMVVFLLVLSSFLPKAGHFIMFWVGPWFGVDVPTLMLDLSLSGIWSIFAIEFQFFEIVFLILFIISWVLSILTWMGANQKR